LRAGEDFLDADAFPEADFFAGRFAAVPAGLRTADFLLSAGALRAAAFVRVVFRLAVLRLLAGIGASRPGGQHGVLERGQAAHSRQRAAESKLRFLARFSPRVQPREWGKAGAAGLLRRQHPTAG
jgi:hypothetical protein